LIPQLEEIVLPLVQYIDGIRNLDFEEDILLLITYFPLDIGHLSIRERKLP